MLQPASLTGFLSGYFHEDWELEFTDWRAAVRHFVETDAASAPGVSRELRDARTNLTGEDDAQAFLWKAGCYFVPPGRTLQWLSELQASLEERP